MIGGEDIILLEPSGDIGRGFVVDDIVVGQAELQLWSGKEEES